MSDKKRRHHYVWKKYLEAWAPTGKIWCRRDSEPFQTALVNVAQKRDFYKLKSLTADDHQFIRMLSRGRHFGVLDDFFDLWLSRLNDIEQARVAADNDPEKEKDVDLLIHNFEEDYHQLVENKSDGHLRSILQEDISFFEIESDRSVFSHYICMQYVRTKRILENLKAAFADVELKYGFSVERSWPAMRAIDAASMALSIYAQKKYRMVLLVNDTGTGFLTGDQPVLNTHGVENFGKEIPTKVEFYYPVSPRLAILISESVDYLNSQRIQVGPDDVNRYNRFIVLASHEQIYSDNRDQLLTA